MYKSTMQSSKQYERFCLPRCLFLNPILRWHLSVEQNVRNTSVQRPFFIHFHISPHILLSQLPMDVTLCMCLSQKKSSWQKGGAQNCENSTGQDFLLLWMKPWHPECWMDKDQSQTENVCLSVTPPVSPSGCLPPHHPCRTEDPDRSRGSCLQLRPWRIWLYNQTRVCVYCRPARPSLLFLSVLSGNTVLLWQVEHFEVHSLLCGSAGKWIGDKDEPGESELRKKKCHYCI